MHFPLGGAGWGGSVCAAGGGGGGMGRYEKEKLAFSNHFL